MIEVFAVATRGLEPVSAAELARLPQVHVTEVAYRRVAARCTGPLAPLLDLRTVDDVFLTAGTWLDIGSDRSALGALRALSADLDLYRAAAIIADLRPISRPPVFSVTANFVGERNYTAPEIKEACAAGIGERHYGWTYTADDREADLNLRVFIEHARAEVGVRLAAAPLQNRPYKVAHVPGSLKPPVAAALVWLAAADAPAPVLDPSCGAGTILVEAAAGGMPALGGDLDPAAVAATRANAAAAGVTVPVQRWDARRMPLRTGAVARVVTNPPWGRKVTVDADLATFYGRLGGEVARVLADDGRAVVLTWAPELIRAWPLRLEQEIEISLYGRQPSVMVLTR